MERIIKGRGCGKTFDLVLRSAAMQIPILTAYGTVHIKDMAQKLNMNIPEPVTIKDIRGGGVQLNAVLVDDAEYVLAALVKGQCGAEVKSIAITPCEILNF